MKKKAFFIDRHEGGDRAILVHVSLYQHEASDALHEFKELVSSAGVTNLSLITAKRSKPDIKYFVGKGKVDEIHQAVKVFDANVVIFNHDLSSSQERELEKILQCRVVDRTGLILDIFAQRARTFEGKLQVELAQLNHLSTRLVRGWTHLERQKGGIGLRGPGETQLESDKRMLAVRIKAIKKSLVKVSGQRQQNRRARQRAAMPCISLVGYTNAGKSTLFNALTQAKVYAADQLFATLDPTLRLLQIPAVGKVMLADTVGFIRDLPHDLVAAFRATLEETRQAHLLLHVIDSSHAELSALKEAVNTVLKKIGASSVTILEVYNKIDLEEGVEPHIDYDEQGCPEKVWCSASTTAGLDLLRQAIAELLSDAAVTCEICLSPVSAGHLRAEFYARDIVSDEYTNTEGNICLTVTLQRAELDELIEEQRITLQT